MREYSFRLLIAMLIGICVLLLFITGRSDQTAQPEKETYLSMLDIDSQTNNHLITIQKHKMDI